MSEEYQVEQIMGKRVRRGRIEYKIKWDGFPVSQCTWEPLSHLENIKEMISNYEKKIKQKSNNFNKKERSRSTSPIKSENKKKKTNEIEIDNKNLKDDSIISDTKKDEKYSNKEKIKTY